MAPTREVYRFVCQLAKFCWRCCAPLTARQRGGAARRCSRTSEVGANEPDLPRAHGAYLGGFSRSAPSREVW